MSCHNESAKKKWWVAVCLMAAEIGWDAMFRRLVANSQAQAVDDVGGWWLVAAL